MVNVPKIKGTILVTIYIPPDSISDETINSLQNVLSYVSKISADIVCCGDFNIDLKVKSLLRTNLINTTTEFGLQQKISEPTRTATVKLGKGYRTSTLIDHFYVSNAKHYSKAGCVDFSSTDHKLIYIVRKVDKLKLEPKLIHFRCFRKMQTEEFTQEFQNIDWKFLNHDTITDEHPVIFEKLVLGLLDKYAPKQSKIIKGLGAPWVTCDILLVAKERDKLRNELKTNPSVLPTYRKTRNDVNAMLNKAKRTYFNNKFSSVKSSVDVWNAMNSLINFREKNVSKLCRLQDNDGSNILTDVDISNKLAKEFVVEKSASSVEDCDNYLSEYIVKYETELQLPELGIEVTAEDVSRSIIYVKKGKEGDIHVPRKIYKQFCNLLAVPMCIIFTRMFCIGHVPSVFKCADVIALYKGKGKRVLSFRRQLLL